MLEMQFPLGHFCSAPHVLVPPFRAAVARQTAASPDPAPNGEPSLPSPPAPAPPPFFSLPLMSRIPRLGGVLQRLFLEVLLFTFIAHPPALSSPLLHCAALDVCELLKYFEGKRWKANITESVPQSPPPPLLLLPSGAVFVEDGMTWRGHPSLLLQALARERKRCTFRTCRLRCVPLFSRVLKIKNINHDVWTHMTQAAIL